MDQYYEEILREIAKLLEQKEYQEVYDLLEEEFQMPYIPAESEAKMIEIYNEVRSILKAKQGEKRLDEDELEDLLNRNVESAMQVVQYVKERNIRQYSDLIAAYLKNRPHYLIKALLIEALIEQGVNETFTTDVEGYSVDFIPSYIELPMEADGAQACVQILRTYFENENPSFLMMCIDSLIKELYYRLPMNLDEDEALGMAMSLIAYVYSANGESEQFEAFKLKHQLDQMPSIDLLLEKHDSLD